MAINRVTHPLAVVKRVLIIFFKYLWIFGKKDSSAVKMDLLKAVKYKSIEEVRSIFDNRAISLNWECLNYELLNEALKCGRADMATFLISEKNCSVNRTATAGSKTPLHYAVELEDQDLLCLLLEKEASVTFADAKGNTPLHLAFLRKANETIDRLIDSIARSQNYVNKTNLHGLSHLHIVSSRCNVEPRVIEGYLNDREARIDEAVREDSPRWKGFTALHFAAAYRSSNATKILLERDRNNKLSNAKDHEGQTPRELVKARVKDFQVIADQLKCPEYPSLAHSFGSTPLHCAVRKARVKRVERLLEDGADVEAIDRRSATPLHLALYRDCAEAKRSIVELVYAALVGKIAKGGVLTNRKDENGLSYLHVAVSRDDVDTVERILDELHEDVNSEVRLNSQAYSNFAPLHFAVKYRHLKMIGLLIERGADVNKGSADGTALHLACDLGQHEIVELLLRSRADVNVARDSDGKTPLHLIVRHFESHWNNADSVVKCIVQLIRAGADVNVKDKSGRTALYQNPRGLSVEGFARCIDVLVKNGADVNAGRGFEIDNLRVENCRAFCEHVLNLRELGLRVNLNVRLALREIVKALDDESWFADATNRREVEVQRMKETELAHGLKLYDFMQLEPRRAALLASEVKTCVQGEMFEVDFPAYSHLVRLHHRLSCEARNRSG